MSQLFDSLRRGRHPQARPVPPRTSHGDAVLATLGYAPVRRGARSSTLLRAVAVIVAIAAIWTGWRVYYQPGSEIAARLRPPASRRNTPASRPAPAATPKPVASATAPGPAFQLPPVGPQTSGPQTSGPIAPPSAVVTPPMKSSAPAVTARAARPPAALSVARPAPAESPAAAAPAAAPNDLDLALYYHRAGDFENALQHYRALLQKNELNAQAHNNLGLLYQEKNLLQESARELQRAVLIEPRNAGAHNNYGVTLLLQGKPDEAAAEFRVVLALDARNIDAMVNLALAERSQNQLDLAKETLLRALTVAPRNAAAHYNLAQLYDQTHEAASAVAHYRRFLETAGPEHAGRAAAVRARLSELSRTPE